MYLKMKNRKFGFLFMVLLLLFALTVQAKTALVIDFNLNERSVNSIYTVDDSPYYVDLFESSVDNFFLEQNDLTIQFLDSVGNAIITKELDSNTLGFVSVDLDDIDKITNMKILRNGAARIEKPVDFCNNNNICEPCTETNCLISENFLVCGDCPANSEDNFCDLQKDNICDPDCVNQYDCDNCKTTCLFEEFETCSSKQAIICNENQTCTGEFIFADDSDWYCCTGRCMDPDQPSPSGVIGYFGPIQEREIVVDERGEIIEVEPEEINPFLSIITYIVMMFALMFIVGIVFIVQVHKKNKFQIEQIHNSITNMRLRRYNDIQIKKMLITQGWKESQINKAFSIKK